MHPSVNDKRKKLLCSTRHVSEVTTIASEFGNSAKIIVPRSWLRKRVIAFLHSEFISKHPEERTEEHRRPGQNPSVDYFL